MPRWPTSCGRCVSIWWGATWQRSASGVPWRARRAPRLIEVERGLAAAITELDAAADATAAELATQREDDIVVALTRVQGLAERCRGLAGVVTERRRSIERALEASADTDVVSTLEAERGAVVGRAR